MIRTKLATCDDYRGMLVDEHTHTESRTMELPEVLWATQHGSPSAVEEQESYSLVTKTFKLCTLDEVEAIHHLTLSYAHIIYAMRTRA